MEHVEAAAVGAGQAGLAVSHELIRRSSLLVGVGEDAGVVAGQIAPRAERRAS